MRGHSKHVLAGADEVREETGDAYAPAVKDQPLGARTRDRSPPGGRVGGIQSSVGGGRVPAVGDRRGSGGPTGEVSFYLSMQAVEELWLADQVDRAMACSMCVAEDQPWLRG